MNATSEKEKFKTSHWLEIRKTLSRCSKSDLLSLVAELYGLSKSNKEFLEAKFLRSTHTHILERYKSQIKRYLAPGEPWKESQRISIKEAKQVISYYKKATNDINGLLDLMIYYVECGTDFLCEYGDMYEQYYTSLESVFNHVLKLMKQYRLERTQDFEERLESILKKSTYMGWGYHDSIQEIYSNR